jgi:hypothetical protein
MQENYNSLKIRAGEGEIFGCLKLFGEPEPAENFVQKVLVREGFEDAGPLE